MHLSEGLSVEYGNKNIEFSGNNPDKVYYIKGDYSRIGYYGTYYGYLAEADPAIKFIRGKDNGKDNWQYLFVSGLFKDCSQLKYIYTNDNINVIMSRTCENCAVLDTVRIKQRYSNAISGICYDYYPTTDYIEVYYQKGGSWYDEESKQWYGYFNSIIESEAFVNCPNLTSVIIDGTETVIEDNAFVNCGDITIYCPRGSKAEEFAVKNGYKHVNIPEMTELEKQIFDEELYLSFHPELVDSPFDSEELLYAHWLANGMQSGGSHVFDAEYYLNANPDLKKAFGDDKEAAYRHFLLNGYKELRDSSPEYCGKAYKNRYKDLADMTSEQLITHYLSYGINEGRNAAAERVLKYGDVNCDGVLTSADSAYIMQKVLNSDFKLPVEIYEKNYKKYADVDGDDRITANDSACIMQKVLNSSYKMPVEFT
jgi:hypothetical protein